MQTNIEFEKQLQKTAKSRDELFFQLGMAYSTGRSVEQDNIAAHKWFNLAAMNGNVEAVGYRRDLAEVMQQEEIVEALRQAREWLRENRA